MRKLTAYISWLIFLAIVFLPAFSMGSDESDALETSLYELCGQNENVGELSIEEIKKMIVQCDTLKEKITQSVHPKKKVFLFRLKKCRNFLEFTALNQTKELESSTQ